MRRPRSMGFGCLVVTALLGTVAAMGMGPMPAAGQCADPPADTGESQLAGSARILRAAELDLSCRPSILHAREGQWTFFLEGSDAFSITRGELVLADRVFAAAAMRRPTPHSLLLDFTYPPVPLGAAAALRLYTRGAEHPAVEFELTVTPSLEVEPENRQPDLVRVQFERGAVEYLLHGLGASDPVRERYVDELSGDPELLRTLRAMGIHRLRKVMPRYAEDDSIHWDPRYLRDIVYRGTQLRQYVLFLDEDWSEAAYKEILLGVPRVEKAFVNEDKSKTRRR
jgi:hypothetical protein